MKILQLHNHYLASGGEDAVVEAERKMLLQFGHEVVSYTRTNREIASWPLGRKARFFFRDIYGSAEIRDNIRQMVLREKPDIAHVHNTFHVLTSVVYDVLFEFNIPVVQTLHNFRLLCPNGVFFRDGRVCEDCPRQGRRMAVFHRCWKDSFLLSYVQRRVVDQFYKREILFKKVARFIALSASSKRLFVKYGFPVEKISIKPNFLDPDPGQGAGQRKYALYVGALREYKGVRTLVRAWKNNHIEFRLMIIGEGPLMEELRQMSGGGASIEFLGSKTAEEVLKYLKEAAFLIVPSTCYETFSRVAMEAFACGTPVLASDAGALKDMVEEGETGRFFRSGDEQDLARKVRQLISEGIAREEMGQKARRQFLAKFTLKENYPVLMSVYEDAIRGVQKN